MAGYAVGRQSVAENLRLPDWRDRWPGSVSAALLHTWLTSRIAELKYGGVDECRDELRSWEADQQAGAHEGVPLHVLNEINIAVRVAANCLAGPEPHLDEARAILDNVRQLV